MRLLYVIAFLAFVPQALAQSEGIRISMKETATVTTHIRIARNHIRVDSSDTPSVFGIFDNIKQAIYMVDLNAKTYREISRAETQQLLERTIEQVRAQNPARMTTEQVEEQTRRMRSALTEGRPDSEPVAYTEIGRDKVFDRACTQYVAGNSVICATEPSVFGLTASDFEGLRQLQRFEASLQSAPGVSGQGPLSTSIPLVTGTLDGKPFEAVVLKRMIRSLTDPPRYEIIDIRHETFDPQLFELPSGLRKASFALPAIRPIIPPR